MPKIAYKQINFRDKSLELIDKVNEIVGEYDAQNYELTLRQLYYQLVACAFLDNPEGLPVVNHIDGDKHNNDVQNLEWVTYQENSRKALELNARERKPVARLTKNGKVGAVFVSIAAAAKYYGCNYRSLFEAVKNGTPYKGHFWRHCRIDIILEE